MIRQRRNEICGEPDKSVAMASSPPCFIPPQVRLKGNVPAKFSSIMLVWRTGISQRPPSRHRHTSRREITLRMIRSAVYVEKVKQCPMTTFSDPYFDVEIDLVMQIHVLFINPWLPDHIITQLLFDQIKVDNQNVSVEPHIFLPRCQISLFSPWQSAS